MFMLGYHGLLVEFQKVCPRYVVITSNSNSNQGNYKFTTNLQNNTVINKTTKLITNFQIIKRSVKLQNSTVIHKSPYLKSLL